MKKPKILATGKHCDESLPKSPSVEPDTPSIPTSDDSQHHLEQELADAKGCKDDPDDNKLAEEGYMGRHEFFGDATTLDEALLESTGVPLLLPLQGDDAPVPQAGQPDADLIRLWQEHVDASARADTLLKRFVLIQEETALPEVPEAVHLREGDETLKLAGYAVQIGDGRRRYPFEAADAERRGWRRNHWRWQERQAEPGDNLPGYQQTVTYRVPLPETQARADEIAEAWDSYWAEVEAIKDAVGWDAAEEAWEDVDDQVGQIACAIGDATATTLAGVIIKARLAQLDIDAEHGPDPFLFAGLVRDILALGEAA